MGRIAISILLSLGLAFATYLVYLHSMGGSGKAAISTATIELQLLQIAQAERIHYAQNNSYATLDQLKASGEFKMTNPDGAGYLYSVETSDAGFVVTASHPAPPDKTAVYPTLMIDQSMQVRRPGEGAASAPASASAPAAAQDASGGDATPAVTPASESVQTPVAAPAVDTKQPTQ